MDSIRGTALLQFGELLAQRGASLHDQFAPHRISLDVVGDYEKTLSYKSLVQIFEGTANALQMPELGLGLGLHAARPAPASCQHSRHRLRLTRRGIALHGIL